MDSKKGLRNILGKIKTKERNGVNIEDRGTTQKKSQIRVQRRHIKKI